MKMMLLLSPVVDLGGNDSCVTAALFIVWRMLMLKYETEREEESRYRIVYVLILFSFKFIKNPTGNLK